VISTTTGRVGSMADWTDEYEEIQDIWFEAMHPDLGEEE
jgi:hypothetical protein